MDDEHDSSEVTALIPQHRGLRAETIEDVIFFGQGTIHEMIRLWRHTAEELASQIEDVDEKIRALLALEKRAEKKPIMPSCRPHNWFSLGDLVVCYIGEREGHVVCNNFATANVIDSWRYHDGDVRVCYSECIYVGEDQDDYSETYGIWRPEVMHPWEFKYLLENPDFASFWLVGNESRNLKDFDPEQFLEALTREIAKDHQKRAN